MSKVIQLDVKKKHINSLKSASNTLEVKIDEATKVRMDKEAKRKEFENKIQENRINPDVFLMNAEVKNDENAHLFDMDFSEFLLPRKKNPELDKKRQDIDRRLQQNKEDYNMNVDDELTTLLNNIDLIDQPTYSINNEHKNVVSNNFSNMSKKTIKYNKVQERTQGNCAKKTDNSKSSKLFENEKYGKKVSSEKVFNFENKFRTTINSNSNSRNMYETQPIETHQPTENKEQLRQVEKPYYEVSKSSKINGDSDITILRNQVHKPLVPIGNPQPFNMHSNIKLQKMNFTTVASKLSNLNKSLQHSTIRRPKPTLKLDLSYLNPRLRPHIMPNDPMFHNEFDSSYKLPKIQSPTYIAPPKGDLTPLPSPTTIPFPYEKDPDIHPVHIVDFKPLPKQTELLQQPSRQPSKQPSKQLRQPSKQLRQPSKQLRQIKLPKQKVDYQNELYTVLARKNKLPNTVKNPKKAPRKLMKDIYRFSRPFNITFKTKF
jgi:hypothetical protein